VSAPTLEVVRAGLLSTVQDLGRPGLAHLGVPRSGAADPDALRLANRLVGNPEGLAAIETTLLGVDVRLAAGRWVAVTGAPAPVQIAGRPAGGCCAQYAPAGAVVSVGPAVAGVRSYLAVAGGIDVAPELGSRSTDTLGGLGPPVLRAGAVVPLGAARAAPAPIDVAPQPCVPEPAALRLVPGPRDDWFGPGSLADLVGGAYRVTPAADRVGVRLAGPRLTARRGAGLPSEGVVRGAVQVPPGGEPIVFLADHPTTGGYPVVGVVHPGDLWLVAQARPGTRIRFRWHRAG